VKPFVRLPAILGSIFVLALVTAWIADTAQAQGLHNHGSQAGTLSFGDPLVSVAHAVTLGAVVFLAGLVAFVTLVWLPAGQLEEDAGQEKVVGLYGRWMWVLVGLLIVAGLVELLLYAVRASGEPLSLGLLGEALFDTRVGQVWIERFMFGILTASVASYAAQPRRPAYWWSVALVASAILLFTLTQQSHAAAEGGFLPFAADWLHVVAASLWMGGLLGFPILLFGPLRVMSTEARVKLLTRVVPRFSKMATIAVMILILTGLVAALLHVPNLAALIDTSYGLALSVKLGVLVWLLALGAQNLRLRGRGPFGALIRMELVLAIGIFVATGFLTSLPPADDAQPTAEDNQAPSINQSLREPPMPTPP
jgi:copper transport protein